MVSNSLLLFRARHYLKMHGFHATSKELVQTIERNGARQREVSLYTSEFKKLAAENFQLKNYAEALDGLTLQGYEIKPCPERGLRAISPKGEVK